MSSTTKPDVVYFSTKGRVVIPRHLRKEFEIKKGTRACVQSTPDGILIKPVTRKYIRSLRGSLKGRGVLKAMMRDRKAYREN
jgi:AbrB family looped-hinge helix DNA binding protein